MISQYCIIASIIYSTDKQKQPKSYKESVFIGDDIVKIIFDISQQSLEPILVTRRTIKESTRAVKTFESRYYIGVIMSKTSPVHHHLSIHYSIIRIEHNSRYTQNY